jgi:2-polyprenyl-3-methyl-5-hydroxy-6-metoxy-1,4-benzoquinol methylase
MDKVFHNDNFYSQEEIKVIVSDYYQSIFTNKRDRHSQMQKIFPQNLNQDSKILDYGCGMGGVSDLFVKSYSCNVDGVDISQNELQKAIMAFGNNTKINFILLENFDFPENNYDLIFSSQVIEHVHNTGNYLSNINQMLKNDGYLLIGLPNILNMNYLLKLGLSSHKKLTKHSKHILNNYNKASDHIHCWDPFHFTSLLASCGFELVKYLPTEGTPMFNAIKKIPIIGKYIYILPFNTKLSYTMFFLAKKVKQVTIGSNE